VVRTLVSTGELSSSFIKLPAGRVTAQWLSCLLSVSQQYQLSLSSLRGRLTSSNPYRKWVKGQTAEDMVRSVVYRPHHLVLLAARLECKLAQGC